METEITNLCKYLRLSIDLVQKDEQQLIKLKLEDPIQMEDIEVRQTIATNTTNRPYHRREAMVIGMRRLVTAAIDKSLIKVIDLKAPEQSKAGGQDIVLFATEDE